MPSRSHNALFPFWGICILVSCISAGVYLFSSRLVSGWGFPLDDAWIHQTYARNLGSLGQWAFVPSVSSAGSTSPLWTALLAVGYVFRWSDPRLWTYLLGIGSLAGLACLGQLLFNREAERAGEAALKRLLPWVGVFLAFEFHLVWAAVSGMETDLMGLVVLFLFWLLGRKQPSWLLVGATVGIACWVRPDGLTLLGPVGLVWLAGQTAWKNRGQAAIGLAVGFSLFFLPYLGFNRALQGTVWPNTFYAKQVEYASLQALPYLQRLAAELSLPLLGAGLLLVPGFVVWGVRAFRTHRWDTLAGGLWFIGYAGLYAWRLPVTYQYGRYLIPAMPVFFILGCCGTAWIWAQMRSRWARLGVFGWQVGLILLLGSFYILGLNRYVQDVGIIETEMVAAAHWIGENTAPGDLIAVHDIGAVGYYSQRNLIDLAGLVTPEIIPYLRDEDQLRRFLDKKGVSWLVVFPSWYSQLPLGKTAVWSSKGTFSPANQGENITIYRWK